jgi:hypothetical protein
MTERLGITACFSGREKLMKNSFFREKKKFVFSKIFSCHILLATNRDSQLFQQMILEAASSGGSSSKFPFFFAGYPLSPLYYYPSFAFPTTSLCSDF